MRRYNFLILNVLGIITLLFLTGCSASVSAIKQDGVQYELHGKSCTNLPDFMDKAKEGLGQSKMCFRGGVGIILVPKDYPEDRI